MLNKHNQKVQNKKAVLSHGELRDAAVNFYTLPIFSGIERAVSQL